MLNKECIQMVNQTYDIYIYFLMDMEHDHKDYTLIFTSNIKM